MTFELPTFRCISFFTLSFPRLDFLELTASLILASFVFSGKQGRTPKIYRWPEGHKLDRNFIMNP